MWSKGVVASTFATRKTPTVKNNVFGPATIDGKSYPANGDQIGVRATDSGRSDRVNLSDIVTGNDMNGERIVSCGGPVVCTGN